MFPGLRYLVGMPGLRQKFGGKKVDVDEGFFPLESPQKSSLHLSMISLCGFSLSQPAQPKITAGNRVSDFDSREKCLWICEKDEEKSRKLTVNWKVNCVRAFCYRVCRWLMAKSIIIRRRRFTLIMMTELQMWINRTWDERIHLFSSCGVLHRNGLLWKARSASRHVWRWKFSNLFPAVIGFQNEKKVIEGRINVQFYLESFITDVDSIHWEAPLAGADAVW